jgi:dTDP-4-amino-4,6-dideoxygalactose transaminase
VTNTPEIAEELKKLRLHGMDLSAIDRYSKRYQHWDADRIGWKYNMDNIQAALLLPQLRHIEKRRRRREEIGQRTISLPLYPKLADEEVDYVIAGVKEAVGKVSGGLKGKAGVRVTGRGRSKR